LVTSFGVKPPPPVIVTAVIGDEFRCEPPPLVTVTAVTCVPQVNWINLRSMGMRKETRLSLALPVRLSGENAEGELFEQNCTTVDLTAQGLRVEGLSQTVRRGAVISVSYRAKSVLARVMWTKKTGSKSQGHVGLQVIGGWNNLWGRVIPYIPGDGLRDLTNKRPSQASSLGPSMWCAALWMNSVWMGVMSQW
jgi:hypothetical protein